MVRQYIGARYVPKFYENSDGTADWRSGVIYEPLTIVTYNGNSYTSKKVVPAEVGNPSSNPDYWVSTGSYNEQVEEYRQEVEDVKTAQATAFNRNANKRVLIVTDSYGHPFDDNPSWVDICRDSIPYESEGYYFGGAGFGYSESGQYANLRFDRLAQTFAPTVSDPETVTDIVLAAGANDGNQVSDGNYGVAEIKSGFHSFAQYMKSIFTNARLHVGFCGRTFHMGKLLAYLKVRNAYREMADENRYSDWIANLEYALHKEDLLRPDHLHPSAQGMVNIGRMVATFLKGGNPEIYIDGGDCVITPLEIGGNVPTVTGAPIRSFTDNGVTKVFSVIEDGNESARLGRLEFRVAGGGTYMTLGGFNNVPICTLDGCCSMGLDNMEMYPANFFIATSGHGNQFRQGSIGIRNKTIFVQVYGDQLTDVVFFFIFPFSMDADSMRC